MYNEGQWIRPWFVDGADSQLHGIRHNSSSRFANIDRMSLGSVFLTQPEPLFRQTTVSVDLVRGGKLTSVAWPGAQVNASATGVIPGGVVLGIHGVWESPLPGQMVLVGYVDGSNGNPIVINKYPYNALQRPDLEITHTLPMTQQFHGPTDIVMGHHTGSYIALRGLLPVPGAIDISAMTIMTISALATLDISAVGAATLSSTGSVTVSADGTATLSSLLSTTVEGKVSLALKSILGPVTIDGLPGVTINTGTRPVAAMGDLTPTLLGPSPIVATGVACLVP